MNRQRAYFEDEERRLPVDPLADGVHNFDWDAVARACGEPGEEDTRARQAGTLARFTSWLVGGGASRRRGDLARGGTVWRRILVVRWYLDPTYQGKPISLAQLARRHRISPQKLAHISAEFVRIMGVTSIRQTTRPSRIDKPARNATTTKGVGGRGGVG